MPAHRRAHCAPSLGILQEILPTLTGAGRFSPHPFVGGRHLFRDPLGRCSTFVAPFLDEVGFLKLLNGCSLVISGWNDHTTVVMYPSLQEQIGPDL